MGEGDWPKDALTNSVVYLSELNQRLYNPIITVGQDDLCDYNGTTHSAVQNGINACISGGHGMLYIKKGTYTVSSTITVNGHLNILGEGTEFTEFRAANSFNDNIVEINSTNSANQYRVTIEHIKLDGNHSNQSSGSCLVAFGCIQSSFRKCHFENFYNYGLQLWDTGGGSGSFGHHNQIIDCLFDQSESSAGLGTGLYMRNNDENTILASQFQYNKIGVMDETGFNRVESCSFVDGLQGMYLLDCSRTNIINCVFDFCAREGMVIKATNITVSNCTFFKCSDGSSSYAFLKIEYYGTNLVTGNIFMSDNNSTKPKCAIWENGNAGEDTYGKNGIFNNLATSMSTSTSLQGGSNWTETPFFLDNGNNFTDNNNHVFTA